jgi:hypothetical protein
MVGYSVVFIESTVVTIVAIAWYQKRHAAVRIWYPNANSRLVHIETIVYNRCIQKNMRYHL